MREWDRPDRPPLRPGRPRTDCDDAETILVAMGTIADTAITVVDHLRAQGRRVGLRRASRPSARSPPHSLARLVRNARSVGVVERTDEPAAADNPLTREIEVRARRPGGRRACKSRASSPSRRASARRDVAAGDLVAVFDRLAGPRGGATPAARRGRHPASRSRSSRTTWTSGRPARTACAATRSAGSDPSPPTSSSPRSSASCSAHARPGVPALRLGEEGPADHVLPDHRRRAHPAARRARATSSSCRCTTSRRSPWATRLPGSPTAARSSSRRRSRTRRPSGSPIPADARARDPRAPHPA